MLDRYSYFFNRGFSFQLLQLILRTIVLILQRKYVLVVNIQFFNIWEKRYLCILYLLGDIHFSAYLNFTALAKKVSFPLEVLEILMIFIIATPYNLHPSVYQLYFIVHSRARCDHTCKINQDKSGLPGFEPAPCWLVDDSGFHVFSWEDFLLRISSIACQCSGRNVGQGFLDLETGVQN